MRLGNISTLTLQVNTSDQAYIIFLLNWNKEISTQESLYVIMLNDSNIIVGLKELARGGINKCVFDKRLIFGEALRNNATKIILAHNHPSGNIEPSEEDINITKILVKAGQIMNIELVDHLIISKEGFKTVSLT